MEKAKFIKPLVFLGLSFWVVSHLLSGISYGASVDFPKKEITIIVNSGPGGGRDIIARGVANTMSKYLKVPVVVLNLPGAGGIRGLEQLYSSEPDGYTIGVGTPSDIIIQVIENPRYDSKKFTYIGNAEFIPDLLLVKSDSPFRSVKDFKKFDKKIRVGTHLLGSVGTVVYMILAEREGFPISIISGYKGIADATLGLIRGETETNDLVPNASLPHVRAGKVRAILTIAQKRDRNFPDVPTVGEIGYPDLANFALYFWFMAPPGVPEARSRILEDALMKTLKDPEFLKWAITANVDIFPLNAQENTKLSIDFSDTTFKYKGIIEKYIQK
ncbi:MAG: Bug family tripartite tricarboxylate transporter substrate binding protein [Thermodesulfobacteriota bacterium]